MADAVRVKLWGDTVGALLESRNQPGVYVFEYHRAFARGGIEVSPLVMPLAGPGVRMFPTLPRETFLGLPGLVADSLPDRFGNSLIDSAMTKLGRDPASVSVTERLLYTGRRAMGALEFEPAMKVDQDNRPAPLVMSDLVESARRAIRGDLEHVAPELIQVGTSAGGARAKAVIGFNETTREVVAGQFDLPEGFVHCLLKFDGVNQDGELGFAGDFGKIEYAYHLLAVQAGIIMSPSRLVTEGGRSHFMTQRFDRVGNAKLHMQTLCGLAHLDFNTPYVYDYEEYLRAILQLELGHEALEQGYRRMVFNVLGKNCDDHTKNLAFLMQANGTWQLAPAFDLSFSHDSAPGKWTRQHQMLVGGKGEGITRDDLLAVGRKFSIRAAPRVIDQVHAAIAAWPATAKLVGVTAAEVRRIAGYHWPTPAGPERNRTRYRVANKRA